MEILRTSANNPLLGRETKSEALVEYGYLYNWPAATGGNFARGWRLPSNSDFATLATTLGGIAIAGGYMKEIGTTYWNSPNTGADNSSGFNGRGSGRRSNLGIYSDLLIIGNFWSSTVKDSVESYKSYLFNNSDDYYQGLYGTDKKEGLSIRLVKNDSNDPGFVDIDGKRYATVKIGNQVWMAENLMAQNYFDGTSIPEVTDNIAWAALTTGARCSYDNTESNAGTSTVETRAVLRYEAPVITPANSKYGIHYNWFAVVDSRNIAPIGWRVPTMTEVIQLRTVLGGSSVAGGKVKETGLTNWNSPNTGADNSSGFNGRGSGVRSSAGAFASLLNTLRIWTASEFSGQGGMYGADYSNANFTDNSYQSKNAGNVVRLIKTDSINTGKMIGTDGLEYNTVKIGSQVWMAENYKTTKYRNGDWIDGFNSGTYTPIDNTTWSGLTSGALCAYDDDLLNV